MKEVVYVFLGGGLGSVLRFSLGKWINNNSFLPFATLTANTLGCLIVGLFLGWATKNNALNSTQTILLITGFCGGLTTFSTFSSESLHLFKSGSFFLFTLYSLGSILLGLVAVAFGYFLAK